MSFRGCQRITIALLACLTGTCSSGDGGDDAFDGAVQDTLDSATDSAPPDPGHGWDATDPGSVTDPGDDTGDTTSESAEASLDLFEDGAEEVWTNPCPRLPGPADTLRKVVISRPFDETGKKANRYEVLELGLDGTLSRPGLEFEMGRLSMGEIPFTPDGKVGIAPQAEDGTLGVFRIHDDGQVEVVHSGFAVDFYPADVVMGRQGVHAYVLDTNWRNNGGGIYRVGIGCDGTLTDEGMVAPAKLPRALLFLPDDSGRVVVAADDLMDSASGHDTHLLSGVLSPQLLAGASAFGDDEAMVAAAAITPNGRHVLLGDGSFFSGIPNRVAVVEVKDGELLPRQVVSPVDDPVAILASPDGDAALVVSGYSNAVYVLSYAPENATEPFEWVGEPAYTGSSPQLPGGAVLVDRGGLKGRVLIPEVGGIHQFHFDAGGSVSDRGRLELGSGTENIAGGIGVQP